MPRSATGSAVAYLTGTDFGAQNGPLVSPQTYRDLFLPFHKQVNDWVHRNTTWKTFIHSCGSVWALVEDFIAAGFDILNPVQCSAAHMNPFDLKRKFGDRVTFWGGGVDTQKHPSLRLTRRGPRGSSRTNQSLRSRRRLRV